MKKIRNILLFALLLSSMVHSTTCFASDIHTLKDLNLDYTETTDELDNPERGFYRPCGISFTPEENKAKNPTNKLVHLRADIADFSGAVNGIADEPLTDDMLKCLDETLKNIKANGGSTIIRFCYDKNYNGKSNQEPSMEMMIKHIEQLGPVLNENKDVIAALEVGMFGPWGEMHSSTCCTNANVSKIVNTWLNALSSDITISVRKPSYYASWANINLSELDTNVTAKNTNAYRIGVFNDGYLGSGSDLGTYANREKEITWLSNQAKHTLFGGEIVANSDTTPINTANYMSVEGFKTHTSYLNIEWNNSVIDRMKNEEIYNGKDSVYAGKSGFLYVNNHLGYRYVIKDAKATKTVPKNKKLNLELKIENVGFANLVNNKKVTILLENGTDTYELQTNVDPTTWDSKNISDVNISVDIPDNVKLGDYDMYLRISKYGDYKNDNNYQCIKFANNVEWNDTLGASKLATISVIKEVIEQEVMDSTNANVNANSNTSTIVGTNSSTNNQSSTTVKLPVPKVISAKKSKGKLIVVVESNKTLSGYQIKYATKKSLKKAKTKNASQHVIKINKIKKSKNYYFKIRGYKKYVNPTNGKATKKYSKWSKLKKVRGSYK